MSWRRTLVILHRDIGFFCVGLTLIYGISGVAVNHRHHWDYNRSREVTRRELGPPDKLAAVPADPKKSPLDVTHDNQPKIVAKILGAFGHTKQPKAIFWRGDRLTLVWGDKAQEMIDYIPASGAAERTLTSDRPLLRQMNYLHLNTGRRWWTYVADLFAVALIFLALSGMLIVRGKQGLRGRGGLYVAAGVVLPVAAYLLLR